MATKPKKKPAKSKKPSPKAHKRPAKKPAKKAFRKKAVADGFSELERSILQAKGLTEQAIKKLVEAGVRMKEDFKTIGDANTLAELAGLIPDVASKVMAWATGFANAIGSTLVVESGDVVTCVSCGKKQPKDYKSGDLCVHCGKQAEPVFACYWCTASGPGRFCRSCGATFVSPGELELAILLKRDGLSKEEIPPKLASLSPAEKEVLWGRVRARR